MQQQHWMWLLQAGTLHRSVCFADDHCPWSLLLFGHNMRPQSHVYLAVPKADVHPKSKVVANTEITGELGIVQHVRSDAKSAGKSSGRRS